VDSPSADNATRCRPAPEWPAADRLAWAAALEPGDPLEPGGLAARWSPRSRQKTAKGYGRWLGCLDGHDLLDPLSKPADRVTPKRVAAYVADLTAINKGYTVLCRVQELYDSIRVMAPAQDWGWLDRLHDVVRARVVPARNKRARLQPSGRLLELGRSLMTQAETSIGKPALTRATLFRDGLMIALLACRPLRLGNFTAIAIGQHLVRQGRGHWLLFAAAEPKNRQPLEVPFPDLLEPALERYLAHHRRVLLTRGDRQPEARLDALWVSAVATPMAEISLHNRIRKRTKRAFGKPLSPHLFRDAAATSIAIEDPVHARMIRVILGHATLDTAERHYNQARSLEAGRRYQGILAGRASRRTGRGGR
jgi:integrase/recombinase XerD